MFLTFDYSIPWGGSFLSIWVLNTSCVRMPVFLRVGEFSAIISLNRSSLPLVCTSVPSIPWILGSVSWLYHSLGVWWSLSFVYFIDFVINPRSVCLVKVTGDGLHCMITWFIEIFNVQAFCGFFFHLRAFADISAHIVDFSHSFSDVFFNAANVSLQVPYWIHLSVCILFVLLSIWGGRHSNSSSAILACLLLFSMFQLLRWRPVIF